MEMRNVSVGVCPCDWMCGDYEKIRLTALYSI